MINFQRSKPIAKYTKKDYNAYVIKIDIQQEKMKQKPIKNRFKSATKLFLSGLLIVPLLGYGLVTSPDTNASIQDQINKLEEKNSDTRGDIDSLEDEAMSIQDKIDRLQQRVSAIQSEISTNQSKIANLENDIRKAQKELVQQKDLLGQNIRAMYIEGDISTLEMLASSKNISDFVDKQQYRNSVQSKIKDTLDRVNELKVQLSSQKTTLERRVTDQKRNQSELASKQNEQDRLLGLNEGERSDLDSQIKQNSKKIEELRREQERQNAQLFGGGVTYGVPGGGGYPWGNAKCIHTGSSAGACPNYDWSFNGSIWNFATGGYGYRNCTDYVAWKIGSTGRYVPAGLGNAKDWIWNAQARGISVNRSPKAGDAAVSPYGYYGHVMYVEAVYGDGSIRVSDYNRAGDGNYQSNVLSVGQANALWFVHL